MADRQGLVLDLQIDISDVRLTARKAGEIIKEEVRKSLENVDLPLIDFLQVRLNAQTAAQVYAETFSKNVSNNIKPRTLIFDIPDEEIASLFAVVRDRNSLEKEYQEYLGATKREWSQVVSLFKQGQTELRRQAAERERLAKASGAEARQVIRDLREQEEQQRRAELAAERLAAARSRAAREEVRLQQQIEALERQRAFGSTRVSNRGIAFAGSLASEVNRNLGNLVGAAGIAYGLTEVAQAAVEATLNLDKTRNTLIAVTGSTAAANEKFKQLRELALVSPGVTTEFAATLFAQFKAIPSIAEETIPRLIRAIGRLNAVFTIDDPKTFSRNLVQLFTQGFETQDIKEALGRIPIFNQLVESVFKTSNLKDLRALKASGKLTLDAWLNGIADAVEQNPILNQVGESLGIQLRKTFESVLTTIAPAVDTFLRNLLSILQVVDKILSQTFGKLPPALQDITVQFALLAAAAGPAIGVLNTLGTTIASVLGRLGIGAAAGAAAGAATVGAEAAATGGFFASLTAGAVAFGQALPPVALGLAAIAAVLGGVYLANQAYTESQANSIQAQQDSIKQSAQLAQGYERELKVLRELQQPLAAGQIEQAKILSIYEKLTPLQKARVDLYAEESGGAVTLADKLDGLIKLYELENEKRREAIQLSSVQLGASVISQAQAVNANAYADSISKTNQALKETVKLQLEAEKTNAVLKDPEFGDVAISRASAYAIGVQYLTADLERLQKKQQEASAQSKDLAQKFRDAAAASGLSAEEFIKQALALAKLSQPTEELLKQLRGFLAPSPQPTKAAKPATDPKTVLTDTEIKERARRAKEYQDSLLSLAKTREDLLTKIAKDQIDIRLNDLALFYERGLIAADEYYRERESLEQLAFARSLNLDLLDERKIQERVNKIQRLGKTAEGVKAREQFEKEIGAEIEKYLKQIEAEQKTLLALRQSFKPEPLNLERDQLLPIAQETAQQRRAREAAVLREQLTRGNLIEIERLRLAQIQLNDAVETGALAQVDAQRTMNEYLRQEATLRIQNLELKKADITDKAELLRIDQEIANLRGMGRELNNLQQFMVGFNSEIDTVGDAFKRLGQNISRSLANVKDLLNNLKQSFLGFFRDILGQGLQRIFQQLFTDLTNLIGKKQSGQTSGAGGLAGQVIQIFTGAGGQPAVVLGGNGAGAAGQLIQLAGGAGGFLTPGFAGGFPALGGAATGGLAGIPAAILATLGIKQGIGGGLSVYDRARLGIGIGGPNLNPLEIPPVPSGGVAGAAGQTAQVATLLGSLKNIFKGFGFGLKPGSPRGALAGIAPLLGLQFGSQLGGRSTLGAIAGGAGGALVGIGLTAAPAFLASGGSLGFLQLGGLFSNPITVGVGAALLIGSFLLGRSQQRRSDEEQSGIWLQEAINQIMDLKQQAAAGQVTASQARSIFETQILGTFIAQISTLRTRSVRESRLTNQVRDLRNLFETQVVPAANSAVKRSSVLNLIPEFATGGIVPGIDRGYDSVLAYVRPGEMVLTQAQQSVIQQAAGSGIFSMAGVPNAPQAQINNTPAFASGGIMPIRSLEPSEPMQLNLNIGLTVGRQEAGQIVSVGAGTDTGRRVVVNQIRKAQLNREL